MPWIKCWSLIFLSSQIVQNKLKLIVEYNIFIEFSQYQAVIKTVIQKSFQIGIFFYSWLHIGNTPDMSLL